MDKEKIKSFKQVCEICHKLQKKGKKIVFYHGFFDILHRGHVTLLIEAKNLGDVLVVGVDHDDNARILKGLGRPINDHESRMFVLSNLEPVNYVFLIDSFKKDYLVGGDKTVSKYLDRIYLKLRPDIVATCMKAGKYGDLKKQHAKLVSARFIDIKCALYDKNTTKTIKILGLD